MMLGSEQDKKYVSFMYIAVLIKIVHVPDTSTWQLLQINLYKFYMCYL